MLKVLIIDKSDKHSLNIARKIAELYSDLSIFTSTGIDRAIEQINSEKPDIVVVSLTMKDSKGKDLLVRLKNWDFEILIYQDGELYSIQDARVAKKEGFVLKLYNIKPIQ
ncbi:MAG: hypothetical protein NT007_16680 [Candidatus Kapabacteria bacterium]|nr:hypothetical protein [Candidatus Kapabacteria bacterium]